MSLILAVRCKDGCLVLADKRNHIWEGGRTWFTDDFCKVVQWGSYLVYNHGYNRIGERDWKLRSQDLSLDRKNPIYEAIRMEVEAKQQDRDAFYVFINRSQVHEISIRADHGVRYKSFLPHDRILSGNGQSFVDWDGLAPLDGKCDQVSPKLIQIFDSAYVRQEKAGGTFFSPNYEIKGLKG